MRQDFRVNRDLAVYQRMAPNQRTQRLTDMRQLISRSVCYDTNCHYARNVSWTNQNTRNALVSFIFVFCEITICSSRAFCLIAAICEFACFVGRWKSAKHIKFKSQGHVADVFVKFEAYHLLGWQHIALVIFILPPIVQWKWNRTLPSDAAWYAPRFEIWEHFVVWKVCFSRYR